MDKFPGGGGVPPGWGPLVYIVITATHCFTKYDRTVKENPNTNKLRIRFEQVYFAHVESPAQVMAKGRMGSRRFGL